MTDFFIKHVLTKFISFKDTFNCLKPLEYSFIDQGSIFYKKIFQHNNLKDSLNDVGTLFSREILVFFLLHFQIPLIKRS